VKVLKLEFTKFEEVQIGQKADLTHKITDEDVNLFGKLSGDYNPVHFDDEWAKKTIKAGMGLEAILKLCNKANEYVKAYDYPSAHKTSNMLDRIMDHQDRYLYSCKYFHGHRLSSEYSVRAWALLYNFHPYCPRSKISDQYLSPVHRMNGFIYHDNWLKNLKPGVHELLIHPSLMGEEWANILGRPNSYLRLGDYKYWTSPETMDLANELGITFIGYRELQKLQARNWGRETDSVHLEK